VLSSVSHSFGETRALDDASLRVRQGTLHAVLGENGAGKSTLMRIVFGLLQPKAGAMQLHGESYAPASPSEALRHGVGMVHQHFTLVPAMSVAENVVLGGTGTFNPRKAAAYVLELCELTGLRMDPGAIVRDLPVAAQQRVEILKALSRGASFLILDEPTAVLAPDDVAELHSWLRGFVKQGNTAVLVTHKLREALAVADDVTVLRRGRTVLASPVAEVDRDSLIHAIIGSGSEQSELAAELEPSTSQDGKAEPADAVIVAESLRLLREGGSVAVEDASLEVHAGEILGIAGV